jgi:hypothetical protein
MSRTYRRVPQWPGLYDEEYEDKCRRGLAGGCEINGAEGRYDEAWGPRGKRDAKKKIRRQNRRKGNKSIREQTDDLGL